MSASISDTIKGALCCPLCHGELEIDSYAQCRVCDRQYSFANDGPLNIQLQKAKQQQYTVEVGISPTLPEDAFFKPLNKNQQGCIDFSAITIPKHLGPELASYIDVPIGKGAVALDLGCGKVPNKEIIEFAGYDYLGLDYREPEATLRGDAHALPIKDNSVDICVSLAVLEHLQHPHIAVQEVFRVLKPGSRFIGSVAFLQPFHDYSYHHLSHLGVYSLLKSSGFEVEAVAPCGDYSVLVANSRQLFRQMDRKYSKMLIKPLMYLHKLWWHYKPIVPRDKNLTEIRRVQKFSGVQQFVARKKG